MRIIGYLGGRHRLAGTGLRGIPRNFNRCRHFETFQLMQQTGIRLREVIFVFLCEVFLCKDFRVCYSLSIFELWVAANTEENLRRARKIKSSEDRLLLSRLLPSTCQLCTFYLQSIGAEVFSLSGNIRAKSIMTWRTS